MKPILFALLATASANSLAQGHGSVPPNMLTKLGFMKGSWAGEQNFNAGGAPLVGKATDVISDAVGGRYLEERLSTTLPGRKPTDTRHYLAYDDKAGKFKAWWFNDTKVGPMALEGGMVDGKLVLESGADGAPGPVLRATYENPSPNTLTFTLEMKQGETWQKLFTSSYRKSAQ